MKDVLLWTGAGQIGMAIARRVGFNQKIIVGDKTLISNNACVIADKTEITIGSDCRIGANFCCFDNISNDI